MRRTKKTFVILTFILFLFSFFSNIIISEETQSFRLDLNEKLRGIKIDFKPPRNLSNCGSLFNLTVHLENLRNLPKIFSLVVFMEIGEGNSKIIQRIGIKPYVHLHGKSEIKGKSKLDIEVPCLTHYDISKNLGNLKSLETSDFDIKSGRIGVKIARFGWRIIDGLLWNYFINNNLIFNTALITIFNDLSFGQNMKNIIRSNDPFIKWSNTITNFSNPFVSTNGIIIKDVNINTGQPNNQVGKNDTINVTFTIINKLDYDITLSTLVDMSNDKIINDVFPSLPEEIYNLGFNKTIVNKSECKQINLTCRFPNRSFRRANYVITVECAPYIDIKDSNIFGVYFYDYRYKTLITPFYYEDEVVMEEAETFWYNLPIFNKRTDETEPLFLMFSDNVTYVDETPYEEIAEEVLNLIQEKYLILIIIGIIIIILSYGSFNNILYWFVRRKK